MAWMIGTDLCGVDFELRSKSASTIPNIVVARPSIVVTKSDIVIVGGSGQKEIKKKGHICMYVTARDDKIKELFKITTKSVSSNSTLSQNLVYIFPIKRASWIAS